MTLCKTVHAESFLVQSKDTLKTTRNYQQNLRINFHKKKMNFRTRLCSGVNQLSHLKNYVQRKNHFRNTKQPQNTARKQEWREPFTRSKANSERIIYSPLLQ